MENIEPIFEPSPFGEHENVAVLKKSMIFGPNFIARPGWTLWRDAIRIPSHLGIARRTQAPGKVGHVSVSTLNHSGGAGMHNIVCNVCMYTYIMYNTYILYTRVVHSTDFDTSESHKASATSRSGHLRRLKKPGLIRCTRRQDLLQHRQQIAICSTCCYILLHYVLHTIPGKLRQAKVRET